MCCFSVLEFFARLDDLRQICQLGGLPDKASLSSFVLFVQLDRLVSFVLKLVHESFAGVQKGVIDGRHTSIAGCVDGGLAFGKAVVEVLEVGCTRVLLPGACHVTRIAASCLPQLGQVRYELRTFAGLSACLLFVPLNPFVLFLKIRHQRLSLLHVIHGVVDACGIHARR